MKIELTEDRKALQIHDGLRNQYYSLYFILILNVASSLLFTYDMNPREPELTDLLWIFLGLISVFGITYMKLKLTSTERIELQNITRIRESKVIRRRYSIQLQNGKRRHLIGLKTDSDYSEFGKLLSEIGLSLA